MPDVDTTVYDEAFSMQSKPLLLSFEQAFLLYILLVCCPYAVCACHLVKVLSPASA